MNKERKIIKYIILGLVAIFIIIGVVAAILLINKKEQLQTENTNKQESNSEERNIMTHLQDNNCIAYFNNSKNLSYDTFINSEYADEIFQYDEDETAVYYLVCQTEIKYVTEEKEFIAMEEALKTGAITVNTFKKELESRNISDFIIKKDKEQAVEEPKENNTNTNKPTEAEKPSTNTNNNNNTNSSNQNSSTNNNSNSNNNTKPNTNAQTNTNKPSESQKPQVSSKEADNETLKQQMAAKGQHWDFKSQAEAEAFMQKWIKRGYTAGYNKYFYGSSDIAYEGYVIIRGENKSKVQTCGLKEDMNINWRKESKEMYDPIRYLVSLGYDCTGKFSINEDGSITRY